MLVCQTANLEIQARGGNTETQPLDKKYKRG